MPTREQFDTRSSALRAALKAKLGIRSATLAQAFKRSNHLLPKPVRAAGVVLVDAQKKVVHPKMARLVDEGVVNKAFGTIEAHLAAIDVKERRKDARLRWLAVLILNMALVALIFFAILKWRGYA